MFKFRTKASAVIEIAERKIGTIGGWVEHELELGVDLLKQLKGLVVAGVATVQVFKPDLGWSPDVPVDVLDRMIDAGAVAETALQGVAAAAGELTNTAAAAEGADGSAPADGPASDAGVQNAPAADPTASADDADADQTKAKAKAKS